MAPLIESAWLFTLGVARIFLRDLIENKKTFFDRGDFLILKYWPKVVSKSFQVFFWDIEIVSHIKADIFLHILFIGDVILFFPQNGI